MNFISFKRSRNQMHFTTLNRYNNISLRRVHFVQLIKAPVGGNFSRVWPVRCDSVMRASSKFILMIVMHTGECMCEKLRNAIPGLGQCVCVCAVFNALFHQGAAINHSFSTAQSRVSATSSRMAINHGVRERCRNVHGPRKYCDVV